MDNLLEWRNYQRKKLIAAREAIPVDVHQQWSQKITDLLKDGLFKLQKMTVGIYWPFRNEYDPRLIAKYFIQKGATLALPEVVGKDQPLCFREWLPNTPMRRSAYGIPVPMRARTVMLDVVIIPMVGFDQKGYRLGYGSGYFDRTLVTYYPQPLAIGVAFEIQRLEDLYPQRHDIPMHYIVTELDIFRKVAHALVPAPTIQDFDK